MVALWFPLPLLVFFAPCQRYFPPFLIQLAFNLPSATLCVSFNQAHHAWVQPWGDALLRDQPSLGCPALGWPSVGRVGCAAPQNGLYCMWPEAAGLLKMRRAPYDVGASPELQH